MESKEIERMRELEEKNKMYKLKRWEKKELKDLHKKNNEIQKKSEEEKRNKKKKEVLERQSNTRKNIIQNNNKSTNNEKELLEDMCVLGSIMKEEIIQDRKTNPEKFISIEEATKKENEGKGTFCLGILAKNLENMGITTAIEKNPSDNKDSANTVLEFITNGMIDKKKYDFHFDLGDKRNEELLNNKEEQEKFNNKLRKKLSLEYNIPEDKIIITNPQKGSYSVQVIFQTDEFNETNIDINKLKGNCSDNEFKELKNLKEVHSGLIMGGCKLSEDMLDPRGNRESGWGENEKRGGFKYIPPKGWKGYGLKDMDKMMEEIMIGFNIMEIQMNGLLLIMELEQEVDLRSKKSQETYLLEDLKLGNIKLVKIIRILIQDINQVVLVMIIVKLLELEFIAVPIQML